MSKDQKEDTRAASENRSGNSPFLHKGHRKRLRARFLAGGAAAMADHELLELLLTYALPRMDVNPLAHRLIARFGSLQGVLTARPDELKRVPGVGTETAGLIGLIAALEAAARPPIRTGGVCLNTFSGITSYLHGLYSGVTVERLYVLVLDNGARLVDCCLLSEGTVTDTHCPPRRLAEACLYSHASAAVLAHNHPGGTCRPSRADIEMTRAARAALETIGVRLVEHIIIGEDGETAVLRDMREGRIAAN